MNEDRTYAKVLGANITTIILLVIVGFVFAPQVDKYMKTLVPPNITVTPSEVDVVVPDQTAAIRAATSKTLPNLTYYELSLLVDSEFTSFMRMYNHYQQKASPQLKDMIKTQADRINTVMAVREEAYVTENRALGDRQNDFTPLKPVIDDVLESIGISISTNGKLDDQLNGEDRNGSGESPKK